MKKALIIEDDLNIQEILEEILLTEHGFDSVDKAPDGLEGFFKAMTNEYDLITLDQMMPFCNGTEVLLGLRTKNGPNQNTPVLFTSGYIPQISESAKKIENTYFIDKPIDFARFARYVKMSVKR